MKIGKFDNRNKDNNEELFEQLDAEVEELLNEEDTDETDEDGKKLHQDASESLVSEDEEETEDEETNEDESHDDEADEESEDVKKRLALQKSQEETDRLKASQREALVQNARNKQLTEKIKQAALTTVTDEELKSEAEKEGVDFDMLDNFQKSLLKRSILAERKFNTVSEVIVEDNKVAEWADKVDEWVQSVADDVKFRNLKGHEAEFRSFSMKETRRGLDFDDLARSFLFDLPAAKKHTGSLLLKSGGGGQREAKKTLNEDDAIRIRRSNPSLYNKLVKAGKFKFD